MTNYNTYIVTSFFGDDSHYPNIKSADIIGSYMKIICVMFTTARQNGHINFSGQLFSSPPPPAPFAPILDELEIASIAAPFTFQPPPGYTPTYAGSFYLLDALVQMAEGVAEQDLLLFIDPDCVIVSGLGDLGDRIGDNQILAYRCDYHDDADVNGHTPASLRRLFATLSGQPCQAFEYWGGELLVMRGGVAKRIAAALPGVWQQMLALYAQGQPHALTEEHLLNYVFWRCGFDMLDGEKQQVVKRLWTAIRYRNVVDGDAAKFRIWHCPGEKAVGFSRLFSLLCGDSGAFSRHPAAERQRIMARLLNLEGLTVKRCKSVLYKFGCRLFALFSPRGLSR